MCIIPKTVYQLQMLLHYQLTTEKTDWTNVEKSRY